jgi:hypothetical protein
MMPVDLHGVLSHYRDPLLLRPDCLGTEGAVGHSRLRDVTQKVLIGLEGAHAFCVGIFGGVEHLRT